MNRRNLVSIICLAVAAAAPVALGFVVARTAVTPSSGRKRDVRIYGVKRNREVEGVVLARSRRTESPGTFSLWFDGGHAQLGKVTDVGRKTVTREILRVDRGDIDSAKFGSWSGYVHISPTSLGLPFVDVEIPTSIGPALAWRFDPPVTSETTEWAIHIHGLGSSRAGMLRGIRATSERGMTSLVVTYRNDGERPESGLHQSTLGRDESLDVRSAVRYAVDQGATRITLLGWSMGANMALTASTSPWGADIITRVIAVSPVLDWKRTLEANCRRARLPAFIGDIAFALLNSRIGSKALGLPEPLSLREFNWLERATELDKPILIIHGTNDTSVPIALSESLRDLRPDIVTMVKFTSEHTLEWNSDPVRWHTAVSSWLENHH